MWHNFLGPSPEWYKKSIIAFLVINPILLFTAGPFVTGWVLIAEFIFTLALALRCYPLQPGGLLAIEAVVIAGHDQSAHGLPRDRGELRGDSAADVHGGRHLLHEGAAAVRLHAHPAAKIRSKLMLSLLFSFVAAFLSAFLDALTVTAVLISVGVGFYSVYHKVASGKGVHTTMSTTTAMTTSVQDEPQARTSNSSAPSCAPC
jgi:NhaB family Na+:H+ antiporter